MGELQKKLVRMQQMLEFSQELAITTELEPSTLDFVKLSKLLSKTDISVSFIINGGAIRI